MFDVSILNVPFINFLQTTRVEFDLPQYSMRRRYQDFDWLRIKLEDSQPTHLIPVGDTVQAGRVFPFQALFLTSSSSSSAATAGEVCDEGCGGPLFRGLCGDQDESSGQVPEASC